MYGKLCNFSIIYYFETHAHLFYFTDLHVSVYRMSFDEDDMNFDLDPDFELDVPFAPSSQDSLVQLG